MNMQLNSFFNSVISSSYFDIILYLYLFSYYKVVSVTRILSVFFLYI